MPQSTELRPHLASLPRTLVRWGSRLALVVGTAACGGLASGGDGDAAAPQPDGATDRSDGAAPSCDPSPLTVGTSELSQLCGYGDKEVFACRPPARPCERSVSDGSLWCCPRRVDASTEVYVACRVVTERGPVITHFDGVLRSGGWAGDVTTTLRLAPLLAWDRATGTRVPVRSGQRVRGAPMVEGRESEGRYGMRFDFGAVSVPGESNETDGLPVSMANLWIQGWLRPWPQGCLQQAPFDSSSTIDAPVACRFALALDDAPAPALEERFFKCHRPEH